MKEYFAYIRVSTTKQGQEGVSLAEQKSAIRQYADREGLSITGWFEETVTAAKRGRPVFSAVLDQIRAGEAAGLIVHKLDRGTRNLDEWIILRDLHKEGIDLRIVVENIDLSTRSGRMIGNFQAIIAEDYIENLRQETLKGQMGRLKQGLTPWAAPVGYLDNGKGKPKTIDPVKGPLVRQMFELYASGNFGLRQLAKQMQSLGLTNAAGGTLSKTCISKALNNPFYMGRILVRKWGKTFEGAHEPLISKSLFYAVQDTLSGKAGSKVCKHSYRYSRCFKCKHCGYSLIGERQKGRIYYRCHTRSCPMTGVREEFIDQTINTFLEQVTLDETVIQCFEDMLRENQANEHKSLDQAVRSIALERLKIQARKRRLTDLRIDNEIDEVEFKSKKAEIVRQLDLLEEREAAIAVSPNKADTDLQEFLELLNRLITRDKSGMDAKVVELLKLLTSNREISPEGVELSCHFPWNLMLKAPILSSCAQPRDTARTDEQVIEELVAYFTGEHPQRPQRLN